MPCGGESGALVCSQQPGAWLMLSGAASWVGRGQGPCFFTARKTTEFTENSAQVIINCHFAHKGGGGHGGESVPRAGNIPTALAEGPCVLAFNAQTKEFL